MRLLHFREFDELELVIKYYLLVDYMYIKINGGRTTETNNTQANKGSPLLSEEVSYQIIP